jgi:hypothetical protein
MAMEQQVFFLTEPPYKGQKVRWINDASEPPKVYEVAYVGSGQFVSIMHGAYPQGEFFSVPVGSLMGVRTVAVTRAQRAERAESDRGSDPEGLSDCKTPEEFKALALSLGMTEDDAYVLEVNVENAPNAGQRVMRGRNAIRNWLKRRDA